MKKVFTFGKVAAENSRRSNLVTIEAELKETKKGPVFTASGNVWDRKKEDIIQGGQCIDSVYADYGPQLENRDLYRELLDIWQKYHLNDTNAGTPAQTAAVEKWKSEGKKYNYDEVCKHLKEIGLYEDKSFSKDGINGYRYGSAWLYRPIPETVLKRIKELLA